MWAQVVFSPFPFRSAVPASFGNLWIRLNQLNPDFRTGGGVVTDSAERVVRQAEDRLEKVAEDVRARFDRITGSFSSKIENGGFDQGVGHGQAGTVRREPSGSDR